MMKFFVPRRDLNPALFCFQAIALVDIVKKFNWTYVSTIASEGSYGEFTKIIIRLRNVSFSLKQRNKLVATRISWRVSEGSYQDANIMRFYLQSNGPSP